MRGTVNISNIDVEMAANAATPFVYKTLFHEDLLVLFQSPNPSPDLFTKLGYVMAMQAQKPTTELMKLTMDGFYQWCEQFESIDIIQASGDIAAIYTHQTEKSSVPKSGGD